MPLAVYDTHLVRFSYAALPTLGGGSKGGDEDGGDILLQSIDDDDEFGGSLEDVRVSCLPFCSG